MPDYSREPRHSSSQSYTSHSYRGRSSAGERASGGQHAESSARRRITGAHAEPRETREEDAARSTRGAHSARETRAAHAEELATPARPDDFVYIAPETRPSVSGSAVAKASANPEGSGYPIAGLPISRRALIAGGVGVVALGALIGVAAHACSLQKRGGDQPDRAGMGTTTNVSENRVSFIGGSLPLAADGTLTVAIDPGHGLEDDGACYGDLYEANLVWTISNYCAAYLEEHGVNVIMTRGENENPSLEDRALVAANAKANVLLSIHINENEQDSSLNGATVYKPTSESPYLADTTVVPASALANLVLLELGALGLTNNGAIAQELFIDPTDPSQEKYIYPGDESLVSDYYAMVRWPRKYGIPAVLIEHAFLSNAGDRGLLSRDDFLKQMGEADARAVLEAAGYAGEL